MSASVQGSHNRIADLPSEARARGSPSMSSPPSGALAHNDPHLSELTPLLESVWNWNRPRLNDLADLFQMTKLLKAHFTASPAFGTPKVHNEQNGSFPD